MSRTTKSKRSPPRPMASSQPRKTKWWAYVLLAVVLALAWPAYRYNVASQRLAGAQNDMALGHMDDAISKLETEIQARPRNGGVAYWLAVAHRRAGHIQKFNELITIARELNYSPDEVDRQVLLSWLQSGTTNDGMERDADRLIKNADNYSGGRLDLFIDEFYEARSRGFLANFRLTDAEVTLDHWIEARPHSITARMLRANVKERQLNRFQAVEREYREILEIEPGNLEARVQFARLLLLNQKVPEATVQYEICLGSAPDNVRAQLGLAECEYLGGKKIDVAKGRLEKLLAQDQVTDDRAKTLLLLGDIASFQGKHELAVKYLTDATEFSSTLGAAPFRSLASAYASLHRKSQAEKYSAIAKRTMDQLARLRRLTEEVLKNPNNADLRFQQGEMFNEQGNKEQAAIWWNMAVRFDPGHLPAHDSLAEYYSERQDQKLANYHREMAAKAAPEMVSRLWKLLNRDELDIVRKFLPLLAKYPDLKEDTELLSLGIALAEGKDLNSAAERLQQLAEVPRLRLFALTLLGESQRRLAHYSAARQSFEKVLAEKPDDGPAHWGLQKVCRDIGSFAELERHALKVAESNRDDFRPRRALGELYQRDKKWTQAVYEYQESFSLKRDQPDKDELLLGLVECFIKLKNFSKALTTLKFITASSRKSYLEALCLYDSKEVDHAKQVLDAALKNSADDVPSLLLRTDIALAGNEVELAERLLARALKLAPQSSEPHRKFAALLRQKGETAAALEEGKTAAQLEELESQLTLLSTKASQNPEDVSPRKELAAVAKKLGRDEEAKHWEAVVKGMSQKSEPVGTIRPSAVPNSQKLISAPAGK